jgi:hypothetical protein
MANLAEFSAENGDKLAVLPAETKEGLKRVLVVATRAPGPTNIAVPLTAEAARDMAQALLDAARDMDE